MIRPAVNWLRLDAVTFNGYPVFQHPVTGDLAWDSFEQLVDLPRSVKTAIRGGAKGDFHD